MDRSQLKKLSWEQIQGKIWKLFLISLIVFAIVLAVESAVLGAISVPLIISTGLTDLAIAGAITAEEITELVIDLMESASDMSSSVVSVFLAAPFNLAIAMIYINITNGIEPQIADTFKGFKKYWKAVGVYFFIELFTSLWALLFIIPGIVKWYSYSMAPYILAENPEMGPLDAIRKSKEMMDGHKGDLFGLHISFIGWFLLTIVSCGVASIWCIPYLEAATANFYKQLKGEL
ncbi:MAG: DUF975 family protein [Clostridia bacterium]|nr:DUF975 family protein [Clostridia bacterium]